MRTALLASFVAHVLARAQDVDLQAAVTAGFEAAPSLCAA
jgi:hypothetical protein